MMVTALSAMPKIRRLTLSALWLSAPALGRRRRRGSSIPRSLLPMAPIDLILRNDVMPALGHCGQQLARHHFKCATHKTPILVATRALIFSFLLIDASQTINHGITANTISINPENDATKML